MADSVLQMWNLALGQLAIGTEVQDENENSANANACRRFYPQARDRTLEDFAWPFAGVTVPLALVATTPTPEWQFAYRYPSDCLTARAIKSATWDLRNPGPGQIIPYQLGADAQGTLIYCDLESASLLYTQAITDVTRYSASFTDAVAFRLAFLVAPRLTGGDPMKLGIRAQGLYQQAIGDAQANALNETQPDQPPNAEWIADRC